VALKRAAQREALRELADEIGNVRAALAWSLESEEPEAGLRLASAMSEFWWRVGRPSEGSEWLKKMLSAGKPASDLTRAKALVQAARMAWAQGHLERASALAEQSLVLWRDLNDKKGVAEALGISGAIAHFAGYRDKALALLEESLALFRETGDEWYTGLNLLWLADTWMREGDYRQAAALFEEALTLFQKQGDRWGIGFALGGSGDVARHQGNYRQATVLHQEALRLHLEEGNKGDIPFSLEALAILAAILGQSERAAQLWGAADALREALHTPLPPSYQDDYAPHVNAAREGISEAAFAAAWARGKAMTLDQAAKYAMDKAPL
ncbi:MAG: tetratricopeptide repeat protein, partial [Armatimonadetes bacterium]|nr:tetratricopeptide repeat protein [Armatimonadota bacterium]NIO95701.1 tetratricopeptide repeat protein [Armatimonadota bacterium]